MCLSPIVGPLARCCCVAPCMQARLSQASDSPPAHHIASVASQCVAHGLAALALDPPAAGWTILHGMTGERARLPGDGQRRWQLGFDDAGAAFVSCAEESVWCDELFSWRVVADGDGSAFVVDEEGECGEGYASFMPQRSENEIILDGGRSEFRLKVWVFLHPWDGYLVWWSLASHHHNAKLESTMCASKWLQSWWPWWEKWLAKLCVSPSPHLRRVAPGARGKPCASYHGIDIRLMEEHSVSSIGVLALLARWSSQGRSKKDSVSDENSASWKQVLACILDRLVIPMLGEELSFYMDPSVMCVCVPALPMSGEHRVVCIMREGNLDLGQLDSTRLGTSMLHALGARGMPLGACLVEVMEAGTELSFFFRQLLHLLGQALEAAIAARLQAGSSSSVGHEAATAPDPMDLVRKLVPEVLSGAPEHFVCTAAGVRVELQGPTRPMLALVTSLLVCARTYYNARPTPRRSACNAISCWRGPELLPEIARRAFIPVAERAQLLLPLSTSVSTSPRGGSSDQG